jgi:GntR family transcriptional regulator
MIGDDAQVIQMTSERRARDTVEIERIDQTSLARRAREVILDVILSLDAADGRLPAEGVLAEELGVSRTTVRAALQSLQHDGFITRRRGAGTIINRNVVPSRLGLHRLVGFSTLLAEAGHQPSVEVHVRRKATLPLEWAVRLTTEPDVEAYVTEKLFLADGLPAISLTDVIPLDSLRGELGTDVPDSIFELFRRSGKRPIDHAVVELAPRNASVAVARRLGLRRGAAYLALVESHYAAGFTAPVALSLIDVNDAYVRFDVVRRTA